MTIKSGFFNSVNGDRKYDARWFAEYFASFIGNGVFPNPSNSLQVVEGTNMTTVVKAGKGWINGYFVVNDSDYVLQHDIADGVLKRIDRVVMRLNYLTRQIEIAVKKGTSATNPVAPTLQRDTDYVELALADIYINNGTTVITQANITDTRLNNNLCGIVHGTVNQVDTTTIFNQYQAWFNVTKNNAELELQDFQTSLESAMNQWMQQEQNDFETWFATIQDILDENVAATLAGKITTLEQEVDGLQNEVNTHLAEDNEQAHSIDNIDGLRQKVTDFENHVKEDVENAHNASNISVINPETSTIQDLQTFAEQLFTNVSNGKNLIGTAITDVDSNVVVPSEPNFADLASAIRRISTGKKFAEGNIMTTSGRITVNNLDFRPSFIFAFVENSLVFKYYNPDFVYSQEYSYSGSGGIVTGSWTINSNDFSTLLVAGTSNNSQAKWFALE